MKKTLLASMVPFTLSFVLVACGGADASAPGPTAGDVPDPTATTSPEPGPAGSSSSSSSSSSSGSSGAEAPVAGPHVVLSKPADGATGVSEDAVVFFKFDSPMDRASVEAAYVSGTLPAAGVAFSWNDASDQLTITPSQKLTYAVGDLAVVAKKYDIQLGAGARDAAGRALSPVAIGFSTLRRIETTIAVDAQASGMVVASGMGFPGTGLVGDSMVKGVESQLKTILSFSLASLPAGADVESAVLRMEETNLSGSPDATLGALTAGHLVGVTTLDASAFSMAALSTRPVQRVLGANGLPTTRISAITAIVSSDLANRAARGDRTQIRLSFASATDGDGAPDAFTIGSTTLILSCVAP